METPVKYKYTPIWDILRLKYHSDPQRYALALNLEQFYMGFLDFGCSMLETNDLQLRRFQFSRYSTIQVPDYICVLEREGCHKDEDCHATHEGYQSHCHGSTCVEHRPPPFGIKAEGAEIRTEKKGRSSEGINQSCFYHKAKGKCNLDFSQNKTIWDGTDHSKPSPTGPSASGTESFYCNILVFPFSVYITIFYGII